MGWREDQEAERRHRELVDAIRESGGGGDDGGGDTGFSCLGILFGVLFYGCGLYYALKGGMGAFNEGEGVVMVAFAALIGFVMGSTLGPLFLLVEALRWLNEVTSS